MPTDTLFITFYKSSLCPRCIVVGRELERLRRDNPHLEVEEVDVMLHPLRAWQSGIRMIPALQTEHARLSGVVLRAVEIRRFVADCLARSQSPQRLSATDG